mmetsp:Transcript_10622/g.19949  ORF Transcript_10622/g.19949 Transcript_10622/m.19949 type:complete len:90 (+) Transcript_10622:80-349(+)
MDSSLLSHDQTVITEQTHRALHVLTSLTTPHVLYGVGQLGLLESSRDAHFGLFFTCSFPRDSPWWLCTEHVTAFAQNTYASTSFKVLFR